MTRAETYSIKEVNANLADEEASEEEVEDHVGFTEYERHGGDEG